MDENEVSWSKIQNWNYNLSCNCKRMLFKICELIVSSGRALGQVQGKEKILLHFKVWGKILWEHNTWFVVFWKLSHSDGKKPWHSKQNARILQSAQNQNTLLFIYFQSQESFSHSCSAICLNILWFKLQRFPSGSATANISHLLQHIFTLHVPDFNLHFALNTSVVSDKIFFYHYETVTSFYDNMARSLLNASLAKQT